MSLKKLRNLCYLIAGLGVIIVPLIIIPLIETLTGYYPDEKASDLILAIIFAILEAGLVFNLVSNKKMNAPKMTVWKSLLMCLVNGYIIFFNVFRHFSWATSMMEWIQITAAILVYLSIALLVLVILFSGMKRLLKKQS